MAPQQYRVRASFRGIHSAGDKKNIVTIPAGAALSVIGTLDLQRFVAVRWEGLDLLIFQEDLAERASVQTD